MAFSLLAFLCVARLRATDSTPLVSRIAVLPCGDRASLVIEMTGPAARVTERSGDATTVNLEIGPVDESTLAQELSAPGAPVFESVSVTPFVDADGRAFARVRVRLRERYRHDLRLSGQRVYVDALPPGAGVPGKTVRTSIAVARPGPSPAPPPRPASASLGGAGRTDSIADAYRAMESDVLRQARALAVVPDVKKLIALQGEVLRRDEQLGHRDPETLVRIITELDRYANEARALQLKLDAQALRKPER